MLDGITILLSSRYDRLSLQPWQAFEKPKGEPHQILLLTAEPVGLYKIILGFDEIESMLKLTTVL
jgi:hypothetical protein